MTATTYATPAQLRPRVGIAVAASPPTAEDTAKDAELQVYLNAAAATVDGKTRGYRVGYEAFAASGEETRLFDAPDPRDIVIRRGYWVLPIDDNLTISAVTWAGTAILSTQYQRTPANYPYATGLRLRADAPGSFWWGQEYGWGAPLWGAAQQLSITGTWGYSATPPPGITHLTLTLAERLYERTGRQPIDPTGISLNADLIIDRYFSDEIKLYKRDVEIA